MMPERRANVVNCREIQFLLSFELLLAGRTTTGLVSSIGRMVAACVDQTFEEQEKIIVVSLRDLLAQLIGQVFTFQ